MSLLAQLTDRIELDKLVPQQWNWSSPVLLPKNMTAKEPFDMFRVVHLLCPMGKAYFNALMKRVRLPAPADYEWGYLKGRRREGAILSVLGALEMGKQAGLSTVLTSYDCTNAFCSVDFAELDAAVRAMAGERT